MKDNKGFSLVELIIVIAIMAVLVGMLAPQYLKYVKNSQVATDISNAQELATVFNTAYANGGIRSGTTCTGASKASMTYNTDIPAWPEIKANTGMSWKVTMGVNGVTKIEIGSYEVYPNPKGTNGYYTAFHN